MKAGETGSGKNIRKVAVFETWQKLSWRVSLVYKWSLVVGFASPLGWRKCQVHGWQTGVWGVKIRLTAYFCSAHEPRMLFACLNGWKTREYFLTCENYVRFNFHLKIFIRTQSCSFLLVFICECFQAAGANPEPTKLEIFTIWIFGKNVERLLEYIN